jgi:hypothetical protein
VSDACNPRYSQQKKLVLILLVAVPALLILVTVPIITPVIITVKRL